MLKPLFFCWSIIILLGCSRKTDQPQDFNAPFLKAESEWTDSILLQMSLEQKVGQLFLLKTNFQSTLAKDSILNWYERGKFAGTLLEKLPLDSFLFLKDSLDKLSKLPLFWATQEKVSLHNQFTDLQDFPLAASISAIRNDSMHKALNQVLLNQCKQVGINLFVGPYLDRIYASDSVYNYHCFESDATFFRKRNLDRLKLLHKNKILSIAGPFSDLHYFDQDTTGRLDSILAPYHVLAKNGTAGFWVDNAIFKIDSLESLQTWFLKDYWQKELSFNGLMVAEITADASIEKLIHAGTDLFVVDEFVAAPSYKYLIQFVEEGLMSEKVLNEKVRRILLAKSWMRKEVITKETQLDLANFKHKTFPLYIRKLYEASLTLINNTKEIIPFSNIYNRQFELVQFSQKDFKTFKYYFTKYAKCRASLYRKPKTWLPKTKKKRISNRTLILALDQIELNTIQHQELLKKINQQAQLRPVVLVNFGNPLNLKLLDTTITSIQIYERNETTESLAAQLLFGGIEAKGKLPLQLSDRLVFGYGDKGKQIRLKYTIPEEVGIAKYKLVGIDAIVKNAIFAGATPGCQVLVIKDNKVIYNKAFGTHSYERRQIVKEDDLYDVASLTKIAATTLAAMKLYEENKFKLKDKLKKHLACGKKSKLRNISLKKLFIHQSRIQANMPIAPYILYKDTMDAFCNKYFCKVQEGEYQVQVADSFFLKQQWLDTIWETIFDLKLRRYKRFRYSDVNFNLIQKILESKVKMSLDQYVEKTFYHPLGIQHCLYNPLKRFRATAIVPTAQDTVWRHQLLRGYVHDESAALLGGVGGNAGLFANANDLGVIFQMLLNGGHYGDKEYIKPQTINYFSSARHGNHRGLGFDKKRKRKTRGCSSKASSQTFGHTGFTGTCVWVDPKYNLIYVFLSNRIHPTVRNKILYKNKIRERVHSVIYSALNTYSQKENDFFDLE